MSPRLPARRRRRRAGRGGRGRRGARRRGAARPAGRGARRAEGRPGHARASRPRAGRGSSRAGGRRTTRPSSSACAPPAWSILGKTNMDEFAMGSSTEHSAYGPTRNPWDLDRIPGGSGGGSAAAVAAFEAPLAIGTDTGGSIRQPAAVTGTVGVKPTYGGVSRYGLVALASRWTRPARAPARSWTPRCCTQAIAGHDPRDSTSIDAPVPDMVVAARPSRRRARHARRPGHASCAARATSPGCSSASTRRSSSLAELGAEVVEVSCPNFRVRAGGLLPDPAERVLEQPGQVRRHALRPAGRRRRGALASRRSWR